MEIEKNFILVTNRGPDFKSGEKLHKGIGGTKDAYGLLMNNFCDSWLCLASDELKSNEKVDSRFGDKLNVLFVEKQTYNNYYYKFISECLYPTLLGYSDKAISLSSYVDFSKVSEEIATELNNSDKDLLFCDYHLFKIPLLVTRNCRKVFFWFIPFLTRQYYSPIFEEIVTALAACDELYFLNEEYAHNFRLAYKWYFPNIPLKTKVRVALLGPNDNFSKMSENEVGFENILKNNFSIDHKINNRYLLSVSRMDFVKNIPLLIDGFEKYLFAHPEDKDLNLILIAPHHRKDSSIYVAETQRIEEMIKKSSFGNRIHITNNNLSSDDLGVLYKHCDMFACTSVFDGMPLTPLEYILANKGDGSVILSDSIGAYGLLFPNCFDFKSNNPESLSESIAQSIKTGKINKETRMQIMKEQIKGVSLESWLNKINNYLLPC